GPLVPAPARRVPGLAHRARGGRVLPCAPRRRAVARGRRAAFRRPERIRRAAGGAVLRRDGAAPGARRRDAAGGARAPARRAGGGPGSRRALRVLWPGLAPARRGTHGPVHLAPARRRRAPGRPLRDPRRRATRGRVDLARPAGPPGRAGPDAPAPRALPGWAAGS